MTCGILESYRPRNYVSLYNTTSSTNILNISRSTCYAICNFFYCVTRYSPRKSTKILYTSKQGMERQEPKLDNLSKLNAESIELKLAKSPTGNEFS